MAFFVSFNPVDSLSGWMSDALRLANTGGILSVCVCVCVCVLVLVKLVSICSLTVDRN